MSSYVLDTSALLAYIENEDGADEVRQFKLKYKKAESQRIERQKNRREEVKKVKKSPGK